MKKISNLFFLLFLMVAFILNPFAQQFYNYNTGGSNNAFPFNTLPATGKTIQTLYLPGAFDNPSPAPAGNITKVYFRAGSTGNAVYTNLKIRMGQTADTGLPFGTWYTGSMTTVFNQSNFNLAGTSGSFFSITLTTPFNFNPAQSLIIEIEQCGYSGTGMGVLTTTLNGLKRTTGPLTGTACPHPFGNQGGFTTHTGLDIVPLIPPYYNFNTVVGTNTYPFSQAPGQKVQWLYAPGDFNQPSNAPSGNITAIYFFFGGTGATNRMFTRFYVRLGRTGLTSLPTGQLYSGQMDTVYKRDTVALSSSTGAWMSLPLDVPFTYYNDSSLVLEVGHCGYTPTTGQMWICQTSRTGVRRNYVPPTGCPYTYQGQDATQAHFGIYIPIPVGISNNNNNEIPGVYRLEQNYPNPFNPVTTINFGLPKSTNVKLVVYDILGREVKVLVNEFVQSGNHAVDFDASELSSGIYLYKLEAPDYVETKKMMLIK